METRIHHRFSSIFWIMIGTYTAIHAYQLGLGSFRHPDRGFIFFLCALLLIILGAIDLARTFIGKHKKEKDKEEYPIWRDLQWQKVLMVLLSLIVYTFFLNLAGFLLSNFLLMVFLFRVVEPTKWRIAIVSSLITVLLSYAIFQVWLKVPFPTGFLRF